MYEVVEIDAESNTAWVQEIDMGEAPDRTADTKLWPIPVTMLEDPAFYVPED
jgi:hypothetical protein